MMDKDSKIYIAGHTGLVGSALCRLLVKEGYTDIMTIPHGWLNLESYDETRKFMNAECKDSYVFLAAALVGGIHANNSRPAEFITRNLQIQTNVIDIAKRVGVKKLLFLGSSCIYPKHAKQPIKEEYLLSGELEPTNAAYAIAKIAGIKMCESYNKQYGTNFIAAMPTNLYGPGDSFDLESSHVLPAMIRKFHEAKINGDKEVVLWGTGSPRREFLFVDDLAEALIFMMKHFDYGNDSFLNVGTGRDISIKELSALIRTIVGYSGKTVWNMDMPDGTPRKLLDVGKLTALGWKARTPLPNGIIATYEWFKENEKS